MSGGAKLDYSLTHSASHQRSRCRRLRPCERSRLRLRERSLLRLRRLCLELLGRSMCLCPSLLTHVEMDLARVYGVRVLRRMSFGLQEQQTYLYCLKFAMGNDKLAQGGCRWELGTPVSALAAIEVII